MLKIGERGWKRCRKQSRLLSPQAGREAMAMTAAQELANFDLLMM
jgi:hypothetical protein